MKNPDPPRSTTRSHLGIAFAGFWLVMGGCAGSSTPSSAAVPGRFWSAGPAVNLQRVQSLRVGTTTGQEMAALFGPANNVVQKGEAWSSSVWYQGFDVGRTKGTNYEMLDIEVINGVVWYYCYHDGRHRVQAGTPPPITPAKREVRAGSYVPS